MVGGHLIFNRRHKSNIELKLTSLQNIDLHVSHTHQNTLYCSAASKEEVSMMIFSRLVRVLAVGLSARAASALVTPPLSSCTSRQHQHECNKQLIELHALRQNNNDDRREGSWNQNINSAYNNDNNSNNGIFGNVGNLFHGIQDQLFPNGMSDLTSNLPHMPNLLELADSLKNTNGIVSDMLNLPNDILPGSISSSSTGNKNSGRRYEQVNEFDQTLAQDIEEALRMANDLAATRGLGDMKVQQQQQQQQQSNKNNINNQQAGGEKERQFWQQKPSIFLDNTNTAYPPPSARQSGRNVGNSAAGRDVDTQVDSRGAVSPGSPSMFLDNMNSPLPRQNNKRKSQDNPRDATTKSSLFGETNAANQVQQRQTRKVGRDKSYARDADIKPIEQKSTGHSNKRGVYVDPRDVARPLQNGSVSPFGRTNIRQDAEAKSYARDADIKPREPTLQQKSSDGHAKNTYVDPRDVARPLQNESVSPLFGRTNIGQNIGAKSYARNADIKPIEPSLQRKSNNGRAQNTYIDPRDVARPLQNESVSPSSPAPKKSSTTLMGRIASTNNVVAANDVLSNTAKNQMANSYRKASKASWGDARYDDAATNAARVAWDEVLATDSVNNDRRQRQQQLSLRDYGSDNSPRSQQSFSEMNDRKRYNVHSETSNYDAENRAQQGYRYTPDMENRFDRPNPDRYARDYVMGDDLYDNNKHTEYQPDQQLGDLVPPMPDESSSIRLARGNRREQQPAYDKYNEYLEGDGINHEDDMYNGNYLDDYRQEQRVRPSIRPISERINNIESTGRRRMRKALSADDMYDKYREYLQRGANDIDSNVIRKSNIRRSKKIFITDSALALATSLRLDIADIFEYKKEEDLDMFGQEYSDRGSMINEDDVRDFLDEKVNDMFSRYSVEREDRMMREPQQRSMQKKSPRGHQSQRRGGGYGVQYAKSQMSDNIYGVRRPSTSDDFDAEDESYHNWNRNENEYGWREPQFNQYSSQRYPETPRHLPSQEQIIRQEMEEEQVLRYLTSIEGNYETGGYDGIEDPTSGANLVRGWQQPADLPPLAEVPISQLVTSPQSEKSGSLAQSQTESFDLSNFRQVSQSQFRQTYNVQQQQKKRGAGGSQSAP